MSEEIEPTILEYARFYDLAHNHLNRGPLHGLTAPDDTLAFLEDPPGAFRIEDLSASPPLERLVVGNGAAILLSSIKKPPKSEARFDEDVKIDSHRIRDIKLELPLLRTDHELDVRDFARQIVPDLENEFLPLEKVDEENDEGLTWPSKYHDLPDEFARRSQKEKLDTSKDALCYLQETLSCLSKAGDNMIFEHEGLPYRKNISCDPLTPPLLPRSPSLQPFVPSSDTGRIDFLSDHTSPTRQEAQDIDKLIFEEDGIVLKREKRNSDREDGDELLLDSEVLGDIYSPLKGIEAPPSRPPPNRKSLQDRKVEGPLTPLTSEQHPPWKAKNVSFSETLLEIIPDIPPPIARPEDTSTEEIDAFFAEIVAPIAMKAERKIEQEQLQEADMTRRVTVPIMDFSRPIAPWNVASQGPYPRTEDEYKKFLIEIKSLHLSKHVWPKDGKTERELQWAPFPAALGRMELQETITDDQTLVPFLTAPESVDVSSLTWKPEGLRILDALIDSDHEVLEYGTFPDAHDLNSLVRKRKLDLEEQEEENLVIRNVVLSPAPVKATGIEHKAPQTSAFENVNHHTKTVKHRSEPAMELFSAFGALENFMNIRSGDITKPLITADKHFLSKPSAEVLTANARPLQATKVSNAPPIQTTPKPPSTPIPPFTIPTIPNPFILSSSPLIDRKLTRRIQTIYPTAEFIERDFTLHSGPLHKTIIPTPTQLSLLTHEADIILSPSTGLITTPLQKLIQVSLPGQPRQQSPHCPLYTRILHTAPRYSTLLILVNTGPTTGTLSATDCTSLTAFTAFTSTLPSQVQVLLVPDDVLAEWIVALVVKYGIETRLLQDETLWEIFLRRAGMNAFAAQAVLGALKEPEGTELTNGGRMEGRKTPSDERRGRFDWGLPAFVKMSPEERVDRFGGMMGGREVLDRVGKVLDAQW